MIPFKKQNKMSLQNDASIIYGFLNTSIIIMYLYIYHSHEFQLIHAYLIDNVIEQI